MPQGNGCRFDGDASGPRLYAYVDNDPLNLVDPLGLTSSPAGNGPSSYGFLAPIPAFAAQAGTAISTATAATVGTVLGLAGAILVATTTSTAGPEIDEYRPQYVVRGGAGAPITFQSGTALTQNGYGFSVQTAPRVSVEELARGGQFPNAQISVSTVGQLQAIPGVVVNFPTPGRGQYHGTVNVPNPPPEGIFDAIAATFTQQPNPFPVPR